MGKIDRTKILRARLDADTRRILDSNRQILADLDKVMNRPEVRTEHPRDWFRIENAAAEEASIYIYDEIGFWGTTAQGFVDELNSITAPKLSIHINSPGGEVFDGVAIHSALMARDSHITVHIDGLAASAASFIAMAGDRIIMARHATMMIHDASGLCWGNPADMRATADLLDKLSDNIADMYALQADGTVQEWRDRMRAETWFTGPEALAAGLVDEITQPDPDSEDDEGPSNAVPSRLSLAAFKFANRAEAPAPILPEAPAETEPGCSHPDCTLEHPHAGPAILPPMEEDESSEEEPPPAVDDYWTRRMAMLSVATQL